MAVILPRQVGNFESVSVPAQVGKGEAVVPGSYAGIGFVAYFEDGGWADGAKGAGAIPGHHVKAEVVVDGLFKQGGEVGGEGLVEQVARIFGFAKETRRGGEKENVFGVWRFGPGVEQVEVDDGSIKSNAP